jgi:hypothetical protein
MRVVLIGATGMVGQCVFRRSRPGYEDPRLRVFVVPDLNGFDAADEVLSR